MDNAFKDVESVKLELWMQCNSCNAIPIQGTLIDSDEAPSIRLEFAQFLLVIAAERPAAIFWWESIFEIDEWILSELESAGWEEEKVGDEEGYWPSLEQAREYLAPHLNAVARHSGDPYFLMAFYTADGITRATTYQAPWYAGLADLVDDMLADRMEAVRLAHSRIDVSNIALINQLIDEIAAREDFQAAKGLPKRALLVKAVYGEKIPKHPRGLTTRLKQHLDDMDVNFAHVLKAADEKAWLLKSVKK